MKLLKKIISYYQELSKAKRLDKWYRNKLKRRSLEEFQQRWSKLDGKINYELLEQFADIMELPNTFIYPTDRMWILFHSPYSDLREVEAIILFEDSGILGLNAKSIEHGKYRYAKSLFANRD